MASLLGIARKKFFQELVDQGVLVVDALGIPSNADPRKSNGRLVRLAEQNVSTKIAAGIVSQLPVEVPCAAKLAGQTAGSRFEIAVRNFIAETFPSLSHMRPGSWSYERGNRTLAAFDQYLHLSKLAELIEQEESLASALGNDYEIKPDVLVYRSAEPDTAINVDSNGSPLMICEDGIAEAGALRKDKGADLLLHASLSCKWTFRSDRAQNSRSEALFMIRNRKGRVPHIAVITAEPLPSRLASLALGTGDLDFLYHIALPELQQAVQRIGDEEAANLVEMMVEGNRLKDLTDLPLDLAV